MADNFVKPLKQVWEEDLSTAQATPKEFLIEARYIEFTKVDNPISIRIGSLGDKALTVENPRNWCFEGPVRSIWLSWDASSGTVEFYSSNEITAGFNNAEGEDSGDPAPLAHYVPGNRSNASAHVTDRRTTTADNVFTFSTGGSGIGRTFRPGSGAAERDIGGLFLSCPTSGTAWDFSRGAMQESALLPDHAYQPHGITYLGANWGMYIEDDLVAKLTATTGDALRAAFGTGWYHHTGLVFEVAFVGFLLNPAGGGTWAAHARESTTPTIVFTEQLTGVPYTSANRLRMQWGFRGGTPFLEFLANGNVVYRATVPFAADFVAGFALHSPLYTVLKQDATNTDEIRLWSMFGVGCKVGEFTP